MEHLQTSLSKRVLGKIIVMGIGIAVVTWDPLKALHSQCLQTRSRASTNPNLCHSRIFQVTSMRLWR